MNKMREYMLKAQEEADEALFQKIIGNPKPDPIDLWSLSEEKFIAWRRQHDFPVLLAHFEKVLPLFGVEKPERIDSISPKTNIQ